MSKPSKCPSCRGIVLRVERNIILQCRECNGSGVMPNYNSDVSDYTLLYVSETEKAIAVRVDEDSIVVWLPRSQVEYEDKNYKRHQTILVSIPYWLAERSDLL